jgi:hypothetical protein
LIPEELFQPRYAADKLRIFRIIARLELADARRPTAIKSKLVTAGRESVLTVIHVFRNPGVAILADPALLEDRSNAQWKQGFVPTEARWAERVQIVNSRRVLRLLTFQYKNKMNKQISTGLGVAIVTAVGLAVAAVVWFGRGPQQQVQPVQKKQINSSKGQATAQTTSKADETADWKTYSNSQFGFEVKYPSNWTINFDKPQQSSDSFYLMLASPETKKIARDEAGENPMYDLNIQTYKSLKDFNGGEDGKIKNLLDSLNQMKKDETIVSLRETSVNGLKAYEVNQNGMGSPYTLYIESKSGKIYELWFNKEQERKYFSAIENQILSTFKII